MKTWTNWDSYYQKPFFLAVYARKITARLLIRIIQKYGRNHTAPVIAELGGGNSCFFDALQHSIKPAEFHAIDNNTIGLKLLGERTERYPGVFLHQQDVLGLDLDIRADIVFSVGLIEHFSGDNLLHVIQAHFQILQPGGIVIISFPTPTFLYRVSRYLAEVLHLWIFYDEQPLPISKVVEIAWPMGEILHTQINWPIVFTQGIVVMRGSILQ